MSVSRLLTSCLCLLAGLVVLVLAERAWDFWTRLDTSARMLRITDVSGEAFKVLVNQRTDRSSIARMWAAADPISADNRAYVTQLEGIEMPALRKTIALLGSIDFPGRDQARADLQRSFDTLAALQHDFWEGVTRPRADRRPGLGDLYATEGLALQKTLEGIAARLAGEVKTEDGFIGQLMEVKQLAWMARNVSGEASLLISQGLATGHLPADARQKYDALVGGTQTIWAAIEDTLLGLDLPPGFTDQVAAAKARFLAPDYLAKRDRLLNALISGEKPEMTVDEWSPYTVPRLGTMLDVANTALAAAHDHAAAAQADAAIRLAWVAALLLGAIILSAGSIIMVDRRVVRPLHSLRDAMLKLAGGDLSIEAPFTDRKDEIGALAGALAIFHKQAADKAAIEAEQQRQTAHAAERQRAVEAHITGFEAQVRSALGALADASTKMDHASGEMGVIATRSNDHAQVAATAAEEASSNVAGIAAASEQLSASITEISRQVAHATQITGRAVDETRQTDDTVRGLAESASRIGEVVKLIGDIAGQTNLLALNATIEAARAGEAGKGFAVVASEVKSLANQTAKATEEIASQITAVQGVTNAAVKAIKQIGATIEEVSAVASSIAAAVEEQGASTQHIAQNTQAAAARTRDASRTVLRVTEAADATGATAQAVKAAASALGNEAGRLRGQVDDFLTRIRAA
jgi:methyl-accepting chemotaxis protein